MKRSDATVLNGRKPTTQTQDHQESELELHEQKLNSDAEVVIPETAPEVAASVATSSEPPQPEANTPPPAKKRPLRLIVAVLGVGAIAASGFGYRWWQYAATHETTENATVTGNLHPISARIPGTVIDVEVQDNQPVRRGQLLVELDPQDYQVKVQQAQAALESARRQANVAQANISVTAQNAQAQNTQATGDISGAVAAISTAKAAVTEAQSGVPAAQANLAQAEAKLQEAEANFNRYNSLYQEGAIARQQLDTARAAYDVAIAQRNAAAQGIQQAQAKVAQAQEGVASAQARLAAAKGGLQQAGAAEQQTTVKQTEYLAAQTAIAQAEAKLKEAQLQLSYTNIVAPTAGRIGRKNVEVGQQVQPGTPLLAIVDDQYWVVANFKETQLEEMQPGQPVEVKLDAFPHHTFRGTIDSLSPASGAQFALLPPDNATGNFTKVVQRIPVKVSFDPRSIQGYESRIVPGMSAEVTVELQ
ncbi:MAG TPA: HlyD family secretion protein [Allocoleopsis sp.]